MIIKTVFENLPKNLPVFPLDGVLLLPKGRLPLNIFEPRYIQMINDTLSTLDRMIVITQTKRDQSDSNFFSLGCAGKIVSFEELEDNRFIICLKGIIRCKIINNISESGGYKRMSVEYSDFAKDLKPNDEKIDRTSFFEKLKPYFRSKNLSADWNAIQACDDERLIATLAMICPFSNIEKQAILETNTLNDRVKVMKKMLAIGTFEEIQKDDKKH